MVLESEKDNDLRDEKKHNAQKLFWEASFPEWFLCIMSMLPKAARSFGTIRSAIIKNRKLKSNKTCKLSLYVINYERTVFWKETVSFDKDFTTNAFPFCEWRQI